MTDTTLLRLDPIGVPPYSARKLNQTLEPIDGAAQLARTVNGELTDLSDGETFRKYKSTISCTDQQMPALSGVWPGMILTVDCVAELSYLTGGSPEREIAGTTADPATDTQDGFVFYRPRLTMRVVGYSTNITEWDADIAWRLDLEEV